MGVVAECSFFAWKWFIDSHSGSLALGVSLRDAINYRLWPGCRQAEWGLRKWSSRAALGSQCLSCIPSGGQMLCSFPSGNVCHSIGQLWYVWFQTFLGPAVPQRHFSEENWHQKEKREEIKADIYCSFKKLLWTLLHMAEVTLWWPFLFQSFAELIVVVFQWPQLTGFMTVGELLKVPRSCS